MGHYDTDYAEEYRKAREWKEERLKAAIKRVGDSSLSAAEKETVWAVLKAKHLGLLENT